MSLPDETRPPGDGLGALLGNGIGVSGQIRVVYASKLPAWPARCQPPKDLADHEEQPSESSGTQGNRQPYYQRQRSEGKDNENPGKLIGHSTTYPQLTSQRTLL